MENLRLKIFIYILLRDHLTFGKLLDLLDESLDVNVVKLSNPAIYKYACEIAERLLEGRPL